MPQGEPLASLIAPSALAPGPAQRAALEEHVHDEHSTFTWLLEPMIERAGLEIRDAQYSDDGIWARYTCVKPW